MDILHNLATGFSVALSPANLFYCLVGTLIGTLIGVLPGIGPIATISILLPVTLYLDPTSSIIMLAGIFYGAQYGGSTTAILVNLPGEAASVVTCIDGYQMARKGRAGSALAVAALGSFFAGTVATLIIALLAPPLSAAALLFGPAEYFSLMVLGLIAAIAMSQGRLIKALAMLMVGLLLGAVGTDVDTGAPRMTLGISYLADGIDFVPLVVGLYAIPEIIRNIEWPEDRGVLGAKISRLWPSREEFLRARGAVLRGTAVGSVFGLIPGGGSLLSAFASYTLEKRLSRNPEEFGKGAIEGVASPEAANNASAQTSFIPLLTLGIPSTAVMAVMAGALTIQGIQPGPHVLNSRPELFWGLIVSMWVGNLMLVIINLPLVGIWVRMLRIPYRIFYPAILIFSCVGVYSLRNSYFDVMLVALFGLLGYCLQRWRCDTTPLVLAFVLSPMLEDNLRRAMLISRGDPAVFVERPLSLGMLLVALALLGFVLLPSFRKRREVIFEED
ncbi:MAG TPA: tripartite tricarboxylate transporter permease [Paracoccus sp. (in: a-proteobacteria)]|uniref:tripartite tricarboxylate transporter permease n=1 Tax=Paracoccus sp. TaxID=267 RepID=UPI002CF1407E|nr:tripartite tricarboxylate transporter permease [Paracoccus sp. (in: a-proteobacteria)]HWL59033.1 tripartite tricarboxylate transporter permease [Paracoccus sp. (in: a-proteobacteria)]